MRAFYVAALSAFLTLLLASACNLTASGRAEVDRIETELEAAKDLRQEAEADLAETRARLEELQAIIAAAEDGEDLAGAEAEAAALAAELAALEAELEAREAQIAELRTERDETKAEDRGTQAAGWLELLGTIFGGGALGGVLSRLGPSRGRAHVEALQRELAALRAAADAFKATPSRAAGEVGRLAQKIARLEGLLAAFQAGLATDPDEPPAAPPSPTAGAPT